MKQWRSIITMLLLVVGSIGCGRRATNLRVAAGVEVGILKISLDQNGTITVGMEKRATIPTPLGHFGPFVEASVDFVNPTEAFPGKQTLTIVTAEEQWVYDLHGQSFQVDLQNTNAQVEGDGQGNILITVWDAAANKGSRPVFKQVHALDCPGAFPTRLQIGDRARVVASPQVQVFEGPGTRFSLVEYKYLRQGREVAILEGPVCDGGMLWWRADSGVITLSNGGYGQVIGWIPEESGNQWMLEPANR